MFILLGKWYVVAVASIIRILANIFNISGQQRDQIAQPKLSRNTKMDTSMTVILKEPTCPIRSKDCNKLKRL